MAGAESARQTRLAGDGDGHGVGGGGGRPESGAGNSDSGTAGPRLRGSRAHPLGLRPAPLSAVSEVSGLPPPPSAP